MSEHQIKEAEAQALVQQAAFTHNMLALPAAMINGFGLNVIGRMARLTFTEGVTPSLPPHARAAVVMHPEDLASLVRGAQELLARMEEAGLWKPPAAASTNGAGDGEHATH